jgi:hypothetical protein
VWNLFEFDEKMVFGHVNKSVGDHAAKEDILAAVKL